MTKEIDNIVKDFYKKAKPDIKFNQVTERIIKEESKKLIDYERIKRDEAYSLLSNQIIGAGIF